VKLGSLRKVAAPAVPLGRVMQPMDAVRYSTRERGIGSGTGARPRRRCSRGTVGIPYSGSCELAALREAFIPYSAIWTPLLR
jgi:hypothetical protein